MSPLEPLAGMAQWAGPDTAFNLGFIPEDKLSWKPAETAKSALEISNEIVHVLNGMVTVIEGGQWPEFDPASALSTVPDLQEGIKTAAAKYAAAVRAITVEDLGKEVTLPFGVFPMARFAGFPLVELIHHRGQIVYLQALLGDTETHFLMD